MKSDLGAVGILNVGAGDTKLTFDKTNPMEAARAARIVKDMLRRGYALFVEWDDNGVKKYRRATDFDENTCEYIIADFDPIIAAESDKTQKRTGLDDGPTTSGDGNEQEGTEEAGAPATPIPETHPAASKGRRRTTFRVPASEARALGVARTAGG